MGIDTIGGTEDNVTIMIIKWCLSNHVVRSKGPTTRLQQFCISNCVCQERYPVDSKGRLLSIWIIQIHIRGDHRGLKTRCSALMSMSIHSVIIWLLYSLSSNTTLAALERVVQKVSKFTFATTFSTCAIYIVWKSTMSSMTAMRRQAAQSDALLTARL